MTCDDSLSKGFFATIPKVRVEAADLPLKSTIEPPTGFEPMTCRLQGGCSTN